MTDADIILRLGAAIGVGALLGIDRDMRGKPVGLRTMALVSFGSALFIMTLSDGDGAPPSSDLSRVVQGIVAGVGFLGAGAILHRNDDDHVKGLTSAASIWVAAALGIACGLGRWRLVGVGAVLAVLVLILAPVESRLRNRFGAGP